MNRRKQPVGGWASDPRSAPIEGPVDTGCTKPLQYAVAVFLVLWTVVSLLTLFLSERSPRPHYTGLAVTATAIIVGGGIVFAMICLMMAWVSTKGWAWAFWVDLGLLGLGGIGAFADLGTSPSRLRHYQVSSWMSPRWHCSCGS